MLMLNPCTRYLLAAQETFINQTLLDPLSYSPGGVPSPQPACNLSGPAPLAVSTWVWSCWRA